MPTQSKPSTKRKVNTQQSDDTIDAALRTTLHLDADREPDHEDAASRAQLANFLRRIPGLGSKRAEAFFEAGFHSIEDLVLHFPTRYLDASALVPIIDLYQYQGQLVSVAGTVISAQLTGHRRRFARIVIRDESIDSLPILFFDYPAGRVKTFKVGEQFLFAGYVGTYHEMVNLVQPPYFEPLADDALHEGKILPLYRMPAPLRDANIRMKQLRDVIRRATTELQGSHFYTEILPTALVQAHHLANRERAVVAMHDPQTQDELARAQLRMKFEEIFFLLLRLAVERRRVREASRGWIPFDTAELQRAIDNPKLTPTGHAAALLRRLPFSLTRDQTHALQDILADMAKGSRTYPMNRLLQGDVGSGKTIVALLAMLTAIDNGFQAALMVPTEVLASQHYDTITKLLEQTGLSSVLLIGGQAKRERTSVLDAIKDGRANIVIGTHALIQDSVAFHRLGLVVTDEQHRFGVAQRNALIEKSFATAELHGDLFADGTPKPMHTSPDVLIMTATPIPRTLALTLYGDIDVSTIRELPKSRKPIQTLLTFEHDLPKIYEAAKRRIADRGEQVFVVYPLREKSAKLEVQAAQHAYEELRTGPFQDFKVGLIYGTMSSAEKQQVMKAFREKEFDILVGTTVIEVGVDVPNATVMIIQHADRFGIAQLHQLRGRVGRGPAASACILVASEKLNETTGSETSDQLEAKSLALDRLRFVASTTDGFALAQEDSRVRGTGELLGVRQSGRQLLRIADLSRDVNIVEAANGFIQTLMASDPHLREPALTPTRQEFLQRYRDADSFLHVG